MATCKSTAPPRALDWLASRRRWLVPLIGVLVFASLVGITAIASDWLERAVWLAGGTAIVTVVLRVDQWRYLSFLSKSDRAWIAGLRDQPSSAGWIEQYLEMMERLGKRWDRCHRGLALVEALTACIAWIEQHRTELPAGEQRDLVFLMCDAVRSGSRLATPSETIACMDRLRHLLIILDRGTVDYWRRSESDS